jgi:serine/threonine protein kinase
MYALKTMISFEVTAEERKEFRNELQLLRNLDHPHIVQVHNQSFIQAHAQIMLPTLHSCEWCWYSFPLTDL